MKRFNIFNLEEEDISIDAGGDDSTATDADIEVGAKAEVEVVQDIAAVEDYIETLNDAIEVKYDLEDQVTKNEELIESGSVVTPDQVAVAQEAFYNSLSKLGPIANRINISRELSDPVPLSRLMITVEDQKGIIDKIIEKIKAFFKAIKDWFIKILQKIGIIKEIRDKKIRKIIDKVKKMDVDNLKSDDVVISEKLVDL